jgi:hypothetical protein
VSDRGWVDAVGGEALVPAPDAIARDYILLGLRLDQLMPGIVDSYIGPRDLKAQVDMAPVPTATQLAADARELRERVARQVAEPDRARWLDRQLLALETLAALQVGATMPYVEEVRRCFDAAPEALPAGAYAAARAALDAALPGSGEIRRRMEAWDERLVVPAERLAAVVAWLVPRLREASGVVFAAPAGESVKVSLVADQPWSGYNWYDGGLVSRVDLNTDLPIRAPDLVATLSHETFPGHHLEHTWKEARLIREQGRLEASLLLLNTPECFVSEGLAELGRRYVLPRDAHLALLMGVFAAAGIAANTADAERALAVAEARRSIRGAGGDAALMLHRDGLPAATVQAFLEAEALDTPERAAKRIEFVSHPLWRTYVFSYAGGERSLQDWCSLDGESAAPARFFRLLTEQLTPSGMVEEVARTRPA